MSRKLKIEKQLKQVISEWMTANAFLDKSFALTTITEVNMSNDSSFAMIYITSFEQVDRTTEILNNNKYDIQKFIASALYLKRTPRIRFKVDQPSENYKAINAILNEE